MNKTTKSKHRFSTYLLICIAITIFVAAIGAFDTGDLELLCNQDNKILKRINGTWSCGDDESGGSSYWEINGTISALRPISLTNFKLFESADVGDDEFGKFFYLYRKAAEGNEFTRQYINKDGQYRWESTADMHINSNDDTMFQPKAFGNITFFAEADWDYNENRFRQYGYITEIDAAKYIQWRLDDADNTFHLSRQDDNVTGFKIEMPVEIDNDVKMNNNLNVSGTIYYGALEANSPILMRTDDEFVATCTVASDGELVVEYIKEDKGKYERVIEKVDKNNLNWWHQDCYKKNEMFKLYDSVKGLGYEVEYQQEVYINNGGGIAEGDDEYLSETTQKVNKTFKKYVKYEYEDIGFDDNTKTAKIKGEKKK